LFSDLALDDLLAKPDATDAGKVDVAKHWQVAVVCADETEQRRVFEELTAKGYTCQVLTF